ncbi:MFS transporter [Streptomyces sp. NPDC055400]
MAVTAAMAIAGNYYAQPLLPMIGREFDISNGTAALIMTLGQLGYTCGLLFIVPLADLLERRRLVVVMSLAAAVALAILGSATSAAVLLPVALLVGTASVLAQLIVLTATALADDAERGRALGTVSAGLTLGILLARTVSGALGDAGGWRLTYWLAAALMLVQAGVLARVLPRSQEAGPRLRYGALLRSIPALLRDEPVLRLRVGYGMAMFASFNLMWTAIVFLLAEPPYAYAAGAIGLFGLAGAVGAAASSTTGRLADRGLSVPVTGVASFLLVAAWLPLWLGGHSLAALIAGVVVLDLGLHVMSVLNMSEILGLRPEARSRLQAAYLLCYFVAGAAGSALAALLWTHFGWTAVCVAGAACGALDVLLWLATCRSPRLRAADRSLD